MLYQGPLYVYISFVCHSTFQIPDVKLQPSSPVGSKLAPPAFPVLDISGMIHALDKSTVGVHSQLSFALIVLVLTLYVPHSLCLVLLTCVGPVGLSFGHAKYLALVLLHPVFGQRPQMGQ